MRSAVPSPNSKLSPPSNMADYSEIPPPSPPIVLPPQNESSPPPSPTEVLPPKSQSSPPPSPPKVHHRNDVSSADLLTDLVMWRRKQLNLFTLLSATAAWTVMEVYQYSFITVLSYIAMAVTVCLFFWGNIHRLLKKEAPDLSELEISEETAVGCANSLRQMAEEGARLMFHVSVEKEWFVFAAVVGFLYLLSLMARQFDFLTLCFIGVMGGLTVPVIYVKNERRIREFGEIVRMKSRRCYSMVEEKFQRMKNKIASGRRKEIKEKKME